MSIQATQLSFSAEEFTSILHKYIHTLINLSLSHIRVGGEEIQFFNQGISKRFPNLKSLHLKEVSPQILGLFAIIECPNLHTLEIVKQSRPGKFWLSKRSFQKLSLDFDQNISWNPKLKWIFQNPFLWFFCSLFQNWKSWKSERIQRLKSGFHVSIFQHSRFCCSSWRWRSDSRI